MARHRRQNYSTVYPSEQSQPMFTTGGNLDYFMEYQATPFVSAAPSQKRKIFDSARKSPKNGDHANRTSINRKSHMEKQQLEMIINKLSHLEPKASGSKLKKKSTR